MTKTKTSKKKRATTKPGNGFSALRVAALNHLRAVMMNTPTDAGFIELRAIHAGKRGSGKPESYWISAAGGEKDLGGIEKGVDWATSKSTAGYDIYLGYNPRKEVGTGTKAGVPMMTATFLDLDLDKFGVTRKTAMAAIKAAPVQPNLVVDSGHGIHIITFIEPTTDKRTWSALQRGLVDHYKPFGADEAFAPHEAAILRLTPFSNKKDDSATSIISFTPDAPAKIDSMFRAFGADRRASSKPELVATDGIERMDAVVDMSRNVVLTKEAGRLRRFGYEEVEILATLMTLNEHRCSPPLPEFEVAKIAASIARYAPDDDDMVVIDEETAKSIAVNFGTFAMTAFPNVEPVIFGLRPAQIGMMQAVPNAGKTTMMLNLAVAVAVGRSFEPLYDGGTARKVLYLDFENTASFLQMDMLHMVQVLDDEERTLLNENLHIVVDKFIGEDPLDLSREAHFDAVVTQAVEREAEIIIIDTMAEGFSLQNENDNSEMKRIVISPLKKLAKLSNACVLLVHHIGKLSEGKNNETLYRGRGASSLAAAARLVLNLEHMRDGEGVVVKEHVRLHCAKVKAVKFDDRVFRLNFAERWFVPTEMEIQAPDARVDRIIRLVETPMKRSALIQAALSDGIEASPRTIERAMTFGIANGLLRKSETHYGHVEPTALWCKRFGVEMEIPENTATPEAPAVEISMASKEPSHAAYVRGPGADLSDVVDKLKKKRKQIQKTSGNVIDLKTRKPRATGKDSKTTKLKIGGKR